MRSENEVFRERRTMITETRRRRGKELGTLARLMRFVGDMVHLGFCGRGLCCFRKGPHGLLYTFHGRFYRKRVPSLTGGIHLLLEDVENPRCTSLLCKRSGVKPMLYAPSGKIVAWITYSLPPLSQPQAD